MGSDEQKISKLLFGLASYLEMASCILSSANRTIHFSFSKKQPGGGLHLFSLKIRT